MASTTKENCREALLQAAESIVVESGSAHLTLEAVAQRAGVSKGGLIYHFPSKEALLSAMIDRTREKSNEARAAATAARPGGPLQALEGEILGQLKLYGENARVNAAMLAVIANSPHLFTEFRDEFKERFRRLTEDQPDPDHAAVLLLATYGLSLLGLLKLSPVDPERHEALTREILRKLHQDEGKGTSRHAKA